MKIKTELIQLLDLLEKHIILLSAALMISTFQHNALFAEEAETTQAPAAGTVSKADREFVSKALMGGMAEVKMGKLANEKGARDDVKEFGRKMVADHGKAGAELESLAKKSEIPVPDRLSPEISEKFNKFSKLSGEEFDNAYIEEMVEDHQHDVAEFEKATTNLNNPELKAFAEKTLPVLKSHLKKITEIKSSKK